MKVTLGSVASYINGFAFKPTDWSTCGLKIIRIQNLTNPTSEANYYSGTYDLKYEVNRGDVLISWSASLGIYIWQDEKAVLNQHIFKVVFDKVSLNKKYFFYQVSYILKRAESETHGATMKHLTRPVFNALPFELPSMEQQNFIANELDIIARLINAHKRQLHLLDELVKSRFVELFGTYPANEKRWATGKVRDVILEAKYGSSRPAVDGGKYPYLRMNNITYDGELDLSDIKFINIPDKELPKCTVKRGDVLFNRTNSKELVGKTCVYNRDEMMVLAGFVIRIRVNDKVLPEFLSAFLNTDFSKQMLSNMCKNAIGQANINSQEMQNIGIYIPPIERQRKFVFMKNKIDKSRLAIQKSLDETQMLFDSLMQKYFGE